MTTSEHTYQAFVIGPPDDALSVQGGRITLDTSRTPHVTATLVVTAGAWEGALVEYPEDAGFGYGEGAYGGYGYGGYTTEYTWTAGSETLADLDPRLGARVRIEVDAVFPFGTQHREFNLGVRSRPIRHLDDTVTIELASDEALLEDWAPLADDTAPFALRTSLRDVIDYVLNEVIPGASLEASPAIDADLSAGAEDDAFTWKAGQSALDFLHPLYQTAGFRLVCDENRLWTLRDEDHTSDGSTIIRDGVNLIDAEETIDRASGVWYDAAVTVHTWTDSLGAEQTAVDAFALNVPYTRLQLFERDTPYPGPGYSEYAVRRAQQRGRQIEATCVSDWRTNTEQPLTVQLPNAPTQTGVVETVEFDLTNDEMRISSRTTDTPDSAWLLIPVDESWLDQPVDESWTEEVIA